MRDERASSGASAESSPELLWVEGGAGGGIVRRLGLAPLRGRARRVVLALVAVAWLPLVVLAQLDGTLDGGPALPFFADIAAHVRFLVAVPLLVLADVPIGRQLDGCTAQFLAADLVRAEDRARFADLIADARRVRDSRLGLAVVVAAAYVTSTYAMAHGDALTASTWYAPGSSRTLSLAGRWYALVSLPLLHLVLCRWIYRMFVWGRFLARVSRLDLRLSPSHPDRAGGLGFLGHGCLSLSILLFATSLVTASAIAARISVEGGTLEQYHASYLALFLLGFVVVTGPLFVFVPTLLRLRARGVHEYGALVSRYAQLFEARWLAGRDRVDASILGSADIQSLADLAQSADTARKVRLVPLERGDLVVLACAGLLPVVPLLATTVPVQAILGRAMALFA